MKKSIMFQGTASGVGKSLMAAALCRLLYQKGYKVAPFKSWNMALNSYVTKEGGEVGRAQALQAEACNVDVEVDMQPFLVKPKGNGQAQVIKRGKPLGDFAGQYKNDEYVKEALKTIKNSINNLYKKYEVLVMEGAGSPAEINIQKRDLANMKVANLNDTPVILVADIDKGGVFASLVGTMELLGEDRRRVKGIIINKFRGDKDSLQSGLEFIENKTGVPVLGVMPYLKEINLPEEDSVTVKEYLKEQAEIKIGIINLPHLSNFTDFDVLGLEPAVELTYLEYGQEISKDYDVLIIPGTKNTTEDLKYLKEKGLAKKIINVAKEGTEVIGICGGYQMLGKELIDPDLTEGSRKAIRGLSLLDIKTRFSSGKDTYQIEAELTEENDKFKELGNNKVKGYEIHMGQTVLGDKAASLFKIIKRSNKECLIKDGAYATDLDVWGTYIHGIFDNDTFRKNFINYLLNKKGKEAKQDYLNFQEKREKALDKLAKTFQENIQMETVFKIMDL